MKMSNGCRPSSSDRVGVYHYLKYPNLCYRSLYLVTNTSLNLHITVSVCIIIFMNIGSLILQISVAAQPAAAGHVCPAPRPQHNCHILARQISFRSNLLVGRSARILNIKGNNFTTPNMVKRCVIRIIKNIYLFKIFF